MKNKTLPPPPGFHVNHLTSSSRKRKLTADQNGAVSEYGVSRESNRQHEIISVSGNSLPQSVDSDTLWNRSEKDQCRNLNNLAPTVQINNRYFDKSEAEKISSSSLGTQPQSFHHVGSLLLNKVLAGESLKVSNPLPQTYNMFSPTAALVSFAFLKLFTVHAEKSQAGIGLQDVVTFGQRNQVFADYRPSKAHNRPFQNDIQSDSGFLAIGSGDNFGENDLVNAGGNVLIRKESRAADIKKSGRSLVEMVSPRNGDSSANVAVADGQRNDTSDASLESSDEKSKSHVGKFVPIVAEKLWDGSLQLNPSVTVSAVAFFKRFIQLLLKIQFHYTYFNSLVTHLFIKMNHVGFECGNFVT